MDVMAQARRNLQLDLRSALATKALQVHYQPLLNLHTKRISTCEALLRWPHPARGMVSPAEFIPGGRGNGADRRDRQLRPARGLRSSARNGPTTCAWPSTCRRSSSGAATSPRRSARRWRPRACAPGRLEIEITESVFLNDTELTRHWLDQLQEMGVTDLARRFRHRLLEPELSAQLSAEQGQDRPLVPAGRGHQPTAAQPAARRRATERRPRHVGGGGGHRDRGAARPRRARDERGGGAGLPVRRAPCPAPRFARCCWRLRPAISKVA